MATLIVLSCSLAAGAQDLPESVMTLVEQLSEQGSDAGELVRFYEGLLLQPLNINAATRLQLEETGLLTLFQLESLLVWRERYGAVRSATELSLVEGFSPERVAALRPFFTFGDPAPQRRIGLLVHLAAGIKDQRAVA